VPVGPEAGEAEAVGFPDMLSTAFEVTLVVILVALLAHGSAPQPARHLYACGGFGLRRRGRVAHRARNPNSRVDELSEMRPRRGIVPGYEGAVVERVVIARADVLR